MISEKTVYLSYINQHLYQMSKVYKNKETKKDILSEPTASYGIESTTNWDIIDILNTVFDAPYFNNLWQKVKILGFNKTQYSEILNINPRTLDRNLKDKYTLDIDKSEKALRLDYLINHGIDTFGNEKQFSLWINEYSIALGKKPKDLFNTITGIEIVDEELTRIEYGVFA